MSPAVGIDSGKTKASNNCGPPAIWRKKAMSSASASAILASAAMTRQTGAGWTRVSS